VGLHPSRLRRSASREQPSAHVTRPAGVARVPRAADPTAWARERSHVLPLRPQDLLTVRQLPPHPHQFAIRSFFAGRP
jgi:hypothetical protein